MPLPFMNLRRNPSLQGVRFVLQTRCAKQSLRKEDEM
jgi:hypothetical protein